MSKHEMQNIDIKVELNGVMADDDQIAELVATMKRVFDQVSDEHIEINAQFTNQPEVACMF